MNSRIGGLFLGVTLLAIVLAFILPPETVLSLARSSREFASMHAIVTAVVLSVAYAVAFAFTIPVTTILAIAFGFLFGFSAAFIMTMAATLVGALSLFLLARAGKFAPCEHFVGNSYAVLIEWVKKDPIAYLLATRFAPLVPFPLAHLIPGEARVRVRDFVWTTIVGTVPASAAFAALGASSHRLAAGESLPVLPVAIGLVALSVLIFLGLWGAKRNGVKSALQEMQKTRSNQKIGRHETTDA